MGRRIYSSRRLVCSSLALLPCFSFAHHAGIYDEEDVVEVSGEIVGVDWVNPHVRITLRTRGESGTADTWILEGTSVNALERWGIERDILVIGETLRARGPRSKFGQNAIIAATAELADGIRVVLWPNVASRLGLAETGVAGLFPPPEDPVAAAGRGIFRVWTPRGRPEVPASELPLTASARASAETYNALADDPALRCVPPGMPVMLDTPYPVEFVDNGDTITMRFEEWDGQRTIYMQPGSGPPVQDHSPKGVSFGRWEGETLAIFTLYIDYPYFDDVGTPQSDAVTVLERYTPSENETRLDWVTTITDAATFTEPVVQDGFMTWEPGEEIKPFNCTLPEEPMNSDNRDQRDVK